MVKTTPKRPGGVIGLITIPRRAGREGPICSENLEATSLQLENRFVYHAELGGVRLVMH